MKGNDPLLMEAAARRILFGNRDASETTPAVTTTARSVKTLVAQLSTESIANYPTEAPRRANRKSLNSLHENWPAPMRPEAYYGVIGELIRMIEPHSEADPSALLVQMLVGVGNLMGRSAHFIAEADIHFTSLYAVIVGMTSKARKGTSWGQVRRVLGDVDRAWVEDCIGSGLSSGEGLIATVSGHKADKRLLVFEAEFARVLQVWRREGNTLSAIMREAWDTGSMRVMTRKDPLSTTDAHISIIGHITHDELRRLLTDTAAANGSANRILWTCARRSKLLPEGGSLQSVDFSRGIDRLRAGAEFSRRCGVFRFDTDARCLWHEMYGELSEGRPGMLGAVTSRAEAQVMRLAVIYAVLDCAGQIRREHLIAALAVWKYCEDSAKFIFGSTLGDAAADEILRTLRQHPAGMSRTEIRDYFGRNKSADDIVLALAVLQEYGLARVEFGEQGAPGRPIERWFSIAITPKTT